MTLEVGIIQKYFDVSFCEKKKDLKITLKNSFKKSEGPKRANGMPYSGACLEYYLHHLGDDAEKVYEVRKTLLTPYNRLLFGIGHFEDNQIITILQDKIEKLSEKYKNKFQDLGWMESWRNKLKEAITPEKRALLSENAKNNWNSQSYRDKQLTPERRKQKSDNMKNLWKDVEFCAKTRESWQSESRKDKIRLYSIEKWKHARENDLELYYRMSHSSINKSYIVQEKPATSIEFKMASVLEKANYSYTFDKPITKQGKTYRPDFYIPKLNLIIECYGDYWHANPNLYEETAQIFRNITAKDIWDRDRERSAFYCENGYNFVYFFQSDMKDELILEKIKEYDN